MSTPHEGLKLRADAYVQRRRLGPLQDSLGDGKDGDVWRTARPSALKIHRQEASFLIEKEAYIRLRDLAINSVGRFTAPKLIEFDDDLLALEMTIVFPPFIVDFASAIFDDPPDLIEDEGHTFEDRVRENFDEHADEALGIYYELASRAGIYLIDLHAHNVRF